MKTTESSPLKWNGKSRNKSQPSNLNFNLRDRVEPSTLRKNLERIEKILLHQTGCKNPLYFLVRQKKLKANHKKQRLRLILIFEVFLIFLFLFKKKPHKSSLTLPMIQIKQRQWLALLRARRTEKKTSEKQISIFFSFQSKKNFTLWT